MSEPIYVPDRVSIVSHPGYVEVIVANGCLQVRAVIGCYDRPHAKHLNALSDQLRSALIDEHLISFILRNTQAALDLTIQLNARTP